MAHTATSERFARYAGVAALGFTLLVLIQNAVLLVGMPLNNAPLEEIVGFYGENSTRITAAAALVPLNLLLLLTFAIGFTSWTSNESDVAKEWGALGSLGAVLMAASFTFTTILQIALVVLIDLSADSNIVSALWTTHSAAFAVNMTGLAITLIGFSQASRASRLGPNWLNSLALAGATCLLLSAVLATQAVQGSPSLFIGLIGFLAWLVWLPTHGIRLLSRSRTTGTTENPYLSPSMRTD